MLAGDFSVTQQQEQQEQQEESRILGVGYLKIENCELSFNPALSLPASTTATMKMTFPFENDGNSHLISLPSSSTFRAAVFDLPTFGLQYHCFESNEKYIKDLSYHGWHVLPV